MRDKPKYKVPTVERLTRAAVHYVDRYATTEAHLRQVLERKVLKACRALEQDPDEFAGMIKLAVEKCVGSGLVDDRAYADMKATSLHRAGVSRRKIELKLLTKGIDRDMIRSVLFELPDDELQTAITHAKRKRLGPFGKTVHGRQRRDKDLAALCRADFSFSIARQVMDLEADQLEDMETDL